MRKHLFTLAIAATSLILTSCSSEEDSPLQEQNVDTSQLLGKWIIYRAEYEDSEPLHYEINGTCGREVLEFYTDGEVSENHYVDEDCYFGVGTILTWWVREDGKIAFGAQNSWQHTITITGSELVLDGSEEAGYIKYYRRAIQ